MLVEFLNLYRLVYIYNKSKTVYFSLIVVISSFLEGLSIGIIFPLLDLILNKSSESIIYKIFPFIDVESKNLILNLILLIFIIFIIKSLFLTYVSWWRSGYLKELNYYFRSQIFKKYILKDYNFFLQHKPSLIMRNSFNEVAVLIQSIDSILRLSSEILVFIIIFLILLYFETTGTVLGIVIFGACGFTYIFILKNTLKNWSNNVQYFSGKIIQSIQQSVETIKFLKISNIEKRIIENYNNNVLQFVKYHRLRNFLSDIPRIYLELLGVIIILSIFYYLLEPSEPNLSYIVPSIALITAAAFRLLPSIGRIINYFQTLYGISASIKTIQNDLSSESSSIVNISSIDKLKFKHKIELKNIIFSYPNSDVKILNNFNLSIDKNKFICFTGESGVGKTTIIDIIAGLLSPLSGNILIDGKIIENSSIINFQKNIGYVSQNTILYNGSIKDNIAFLENDKVDMNKIKNVLSLSKLNDFVASKKDGLDYVINERGSNLSGGQIQRIGIARSLYNDPEILILDEFTSSLDQKNQSQILDSLYQLIGNKTILAISHNKSVIEKADKVFNVTNNQRGEIILS
tara:strand:+ start:247 stop:1968 length:1722 start_codon:yes stop_codon:yes gene_type:complete